MSNAWTAVLVFGIGVLFGILEVAVEYLSPGPYALRHWQTYLYVMFQGLVSLVALVAIWSLGWDFGHAAGNDLVRFQVLAAGLGAPIILRSTVINLVSGDPTSSIGPGRLVLRMLDLVRRFMERQIDADIARDLEPILKDVSFERAYDKLTLACLVWGHVPDTEREDVKRAVAELRAMELPDQMKVEQLGVILVEKTGPRLLRQIVKSLGPTITHVSPTPPPSQPPSQTVP